MSNLTESIVYFLSRYVKKYFHQTRRSKSEGKWSCYWVAWAQLGGESVRPLFQTEGI